MCRVTFFVSRATQTERLTTAYNLTCTFPNRWSTQQNHKQILSIAQFMSSPLLNITAREYKACPFLFLIRFFPLPQWAMQKPLLHFNRCCQLWWERPVEEIVLVSVCLLELLSYKHYKAKRGGDIIFDWVSKQNKTFLKSLWNRYKKKGITELALNDKQTPRHLTSSDKQLFRDIYSSHDTLLQGWAIVIIF